MNLPIRKSLTTIRSTRWNIKYGLKFWMQHFFHVNNIFWIFSKRTFWTFTVIRFFGNWSWSFNWQISDKFGGLSFRLLLLTMGGFYIARLVLCFLMWGFGQKRLFLVLRDSPFFLSPGQRDFFFKPLYDARFGVLHWNT